MTRTRYMVPAAPAESPRAARPSEKDVHRRVFAYDMAPDVEALVRERLTTRPNGFYCDLQVMYMPHVIGPKLARTHIVLNNTPPFHTMARTDEAGIVDAYGKPRDVVKAIVEATGPNPHTSMCGWPFCLDGVA